MLDPTDHRSLAQRLDLFHLQEDAPGMVFWHPNGFALYRLLEQAVRDHFAAQAYQEVRTPQILRRRMWESSGHWEHFREGMFRVEDQANEAGIKPVSCPGHIQIVTRRVPSYRELPIRLAEFGIVHRDEPGGTLHGLMRLRQFTQDDGHVFCAPSSAQDELERFVLSVPAFYAAFGFEKLALSISTRPASRAGDDASWDIAEKALFTLLDRLGQPYSVQEGGGAFYGPKLEFALEDRAGRSWQCGTIQYDLVMPERFDVRYVDEQGRRPRMVMLHRALFGSLERFLGILLDHHGADLPAWLAPTQVRVLPVSSGEYAAAVSLAEELRQRGFRADADVSHESLSKRLVGAHEDAAAFVAVLGPKELASGQLALRRRGQTRTESLSRDAAVGLLSAACARPRFHPRAGAAA
jgi:threonyl-tRNA synthetase